MGRGRVRGRPGRQSGEPAPPPRPVPPYLQRGVGAPAAAEQSPGAQRGDLPPGHAVGAVVPQRVPLPESLRACRERRGIRGGRPPGPPHPRPGPAPLTARRAGGQQPPQQPLLAEPHLAAQQLQPPPVPARGAEQRGASQAVPQRGGGGQGHRHGHRHRHGHGHRHRQQHPGPRPRPPSRDPGTGTRLVPRCRPGLRPRDPRLFRLRQK